MTLRDTPRPIRNKLDMADPTQVRIVIKRLGISEQDLRRLLETAGDSIAALTKQVELERQRAKEDLLA